MKLVNANYGINLEMDENKVEVLILESPSVMREIAGELCRQCSGEDGDFVLSEDKMLKLERETEMILNPFALDFHQKKITTALYGRMAAAAEELVLEKGKENSNLVALLGKITETVNYSGISYQSDFAWLDLFKLYHVQIEDDYESITEKLTEYIKVLVELCGIRLFIFVNIKTYLTENELKALYQCAWYQKVYLILIEASESVRIEGEHSCVIDKDWCMIEL